MVSYCRKYHPRRPRDLFGSTKISFLCFVSWLLYRFLRHNAPNSWKTVFFMKNNIEGEARQGSFVNAFRWRWNEWIFKEANSVFGVLTLKFRRKISSASMFMLAWCSIISIIAWVAFNWNRFSLLLLHASIAVIIDVIWSEWRGWNRLAWKLPFYPRFSFQSSSKWLHVERSCQNSKCFLRSCKRWKSLK